MVRKNYHRRIEKENQTRNEQTKIFQTKVGIAKVELQKTQTKLSARGAAIRIIIVCSIHHNCGIIILHSVIKYLQFNKYISTKMMSSINHGVH